MWDGLGRAAIIIGIIGGIAETLNYLEQSTLLQRGGSMLSPFLPPAFLNLVTNLSIIVIVVLCIVRQNALKKRLADLEQRLFQEATLETAQISDLPFLIAGEIADLITTLRTCHPSIKIVATEAGMELARELVTIVRAAECTLKIDGSREIFPATLEHGKIIFRYRDSTNATQDSVYNLVATRLWMAIRGHSEVLPFPKESNIDYLQIEIGGGL